MHKVEIGLLTADHAPNVRLLLLSSFFLQEPLNERFGFNLPDEVEDFIQALINDVVKDQCSFVLVDDQQIAGVILNRIKSRNHPDDEKVFRSKTIQFIYKMLEGLQDKQTVFDYLQVDRVLYTAVISIDADYRGQRFSEQLVEKSLIHAKEQFDAQAAYTETTSLYSLKAFLKMGYQSFNEIIYENYDKEKLSNMGVHDRCSLVGRKL